MIAVDTNILIYACDPGDASRQQKAIALIESAGDGVLLWQVACEFVAASRKLASQGFTPRHAWDRLAEFSEVFPLTIPTAGVHRHARFLQLERNVSFWDALIIAACLDCGAGTLYTEDIPGSAAPDGLRI